MASKYHMLFELNFILLLYKEFNFLLIEIVRSGILSHRIKMFLKRTRRPCFGKNRLVLLIITNVAKKKNERVQHACVSAFLMHMRFFFFYFYN